MKRDEALTVQPGAVLEVVSKDHYTTQDYGDGLEPGDLVEVSEVRFSTNEDDLFEHVSPSFAFQGHDYLFSYLDFDLATPDKEQRYRSDKAAGPEVAARRRAQRKAYNQTDRGLH